jgi:hypothetical protein
MKLIKFLYPEFCSNLHIKRLQNYFHYLGLYTRSLAGCKKFRVNLSHICTTDNIIAEDQEYQYKEGRYVKKVIIESIRFRNFFITLGIYLVDENRRFTCESRFINIGYSGMWRIYDKDTYDLEKSREERNKPVDTSWLDDIETIYIS